MKCPTCHTPLTANTLDACPTCDAPLRPSGRRMILHLSLWLLAVGASLLITTLLQVRWFGLPWGVSLFFTYAVTGVVLEVILFAVFEAVFRFQRPAPRRPRA